MILEEETSEAYGYFSTELTCRSGRPIIVACETCGRFKIVRKEDYHTFCNPCSCFWGEKQKGKKHPMFGKHHTEETKILMRASKKLEKIPRRGRTCTEETKALMSKNHADCKGENHPRWKGGKKVANARRDAIRRGLGHELLMPLVEGEEEHHVTNEYVLGIPKDVHERFSGYSRRKHRTLVLQWLKANDKKKYLKALCVLAKQ